MVSMPRQTTMYMFMAQKAKKADPRDRAGIRSPAGPQRCAQHGVDGLPADPGLDAEPAAGDQAAQHRRDVARRAVPNEARTSTGNGMP